METITIAQGKTESGHIKVRKVLKNLEVGKRVAFPVSTFNCSSLKSNVYGLSNGEGKDKNYRLSCYRDGDSYVVEKQPRNGTIESIKAFSIAIRAALSQYGEMSEKDLLKAVEAKGKEWSFYSALTELEDAHRIRFTESCTYVI